MAQMTVTLGSVASALGGSLAAKVPSNADDPYGTGTEALSPSQPSFSVLSAAGRHIRFALGARGLALSVD